jgi:hypothetical protein
MAEAIILEFSGVSREQYDAVNTILGIDPETGEGDWPAGMISHVGCEGADGSALVFELWESQAAQHDFMESRLGSALAQVGLPEPRRVEWFSVLGTSPR